MRAYLFDIDGTIISTGGAGMRSMDRAFEGLLGFFGAQGSRDYSGRIDHDIFCDVIHQHRGENPSKDELQFVKEKYIEFLKEELKKTNAFKVMPGIPEWLALLKEDTDAVVGLATGNLELAAKIKMDHAVLAEYFAFGGFGDSARDRVIVIKDAMEKARQTAPEPIKMFYVIGDSKNDIVSGRRAGAITVAVATGRASVDELVKHQPDYIFENLSQYEDVHKILINHT